MKTTVVVGLHGDEVFGLKVAGKIMQAGSSGCRVRIGHPEAIAKRKRFLETDLNRSFRKPMESLEAGLADTLEREVRLDHPDYVVDIHTSRSNVGRVGIAAEDCATTRHLCQRLGLDSMVVMPSDITAHSLIGCFADRAISAEFGRNHRSDKLADAIASRIASLDPLEHRSEWPLPIYRVFTTIDKQYAGLKEIKNLKFNAELGGYPFLAGPDTYESIGGFLAEKLE